MDFLNNECRQFDFKGFQNRRSYLINKIKGLVSPDARREAAIRQEKISKYRLNYNDFHSIGKSESKRSLDRKLKLGGPSEVEESYGDLYDSVKKKTGYELGSQLNSARKSLITRTAMVGLHALMGGHALWATIPAGYAIRAGLNAYEVRKAKKFPGILKKFQRHDNSYKYSKELHEKMLNKYKDSLNGGN